SSDTRHAGNVHTSRINNFPSTILIQNTGTEAANPVVSLYVSQTGTFLGSATLPSNIEPGATWFGLAQLFYDAVGYVPAPDEYHANFVLDANFTGFITHAADNEIARVITNMTNKCAIN
ncbi:MAG: hypothetical protein RLN70_07380, partial [Rhodospirillaceae bacterium]